jgi:hypothetical protein
VGSLPMCRGSLEVMSGRAWPRTARAKDLAPLIPIIDLMLTVGQSQSPHCILVTCAPLERAWREVVSDQLLNRIQVGQQYADANGFAHRIVDPAMLDGTFLKNLKALSHSVNEVRRLSATRDLRSVPEKLGIALEGDSIIGAVRRVAIELGIDEQFVWPVFAFMAWNQTIDIDLSRPIRHSEPFVAGGSRYRRLIRQLLL